MKKLYAIHNGQKTKLSTIDVALFGHIYGIELAAQLIKCNKSTIYRSMKSKPPTQNQIATRVSKICNDTLIINALELINSFKKQNSN